ncbi:MAG: S1C family serine protease [Chloroflexota bacterium]
MRTHVSRLAKYGLLIALALSLVGGCVPPQQEAAPPVDEQQEQGDVIAASHNSAEDHATIADVVAAVRPSVVAITTEFVTEDIFNRSRTQEAAGSGWIISEDGLIVTNDHVVAEGEAVSVTLNDGRTFEAEEVFRDPLTDLAVLRIPETGLPVAEIGDSSQLRVGETVIAIGNSLGMGISATSGIASAIGVSLQEPEMQTMLDLVQTDAAINPGNSGGPLVNMAGQVIGINSIKIAQVGVEGMGYAISVNQALPVIRALVEDGRVVRPWMGVGVYPVDPVIARRYDLAVEKGVLVTGIVEDSPADRAGLEAGDVIIQLEDVETEDMEQFMDALLSHEVGDQIEVVYSRADSEETTTLTLGETPVE